jgi:hypothetical protein
MHHYIIPTNEKAPCAEQHQPDQILEVAMLQPKFENMPLELKCYDQWVVWKDAKVLYDPTRPNSKAKVNDPYSWGSFQQADAAYSEGGWLGVGFVLTGNGIAGVDLDHCVVDGKPESEAMELLAELGAAYIEFSPSGNGLRAFGLAPNLSQGVKGKVGRLSVELYTTGRYLTVTGHVIQNEQLRQLVNFENLAKKIRHKPTEETDGNSSVSSNSSVGKGTNFLASTVPTDVGQRHRALFELARQLKGIEPQATRERQQVIVKQWHAKHLHVIGTKDFAASWVDFRNAWSRVREPYGATLGQCLSNLPLAPEIPELIDYGVKAIHLMRICMALQAHEGTSQFFLSSRIAGELIGCHFTDAAALLQRFVYEGWLEIIKAGAGKKATRYKLKLPDDLDLI